MPLGIAARFLQELVDPAAGSRSFCSEIGLIGGVDRLVAKPAAEVGQQARCPLGDDLGDDVPVKVRIEPDPRMLEERLRNCVPHRAGGAGGAVGAGKGVRAMRAIVYRRRISAAKASTGSTAARYDSGEAASAQCAPPISLMTRSRPKSMSREKGLT